jgi:hypothetical protein
MMQKLEWEKNTTRMLALPKRTCHAPEQDIATEDDEKRIKDKPSRKVEARRQPDPYTQNLAVKNCDCDERQNGMYDSCLHVMNIMIV